MTALLAPFGLAGHALNGTRPAPAAPREGAAAAQDLPPLDVQSLTFEASPGAPTEVPAAQGSSEVAPESDATLPPLDTNQAFSQPAEGAPEPSAPMAAPAIKPSEAMGLNPADGVLSRSAAAHVDAEHQRAIDALQSEPVAEPLPSTPLESATEPAGITPGPVDFQAQDLVQPDQAIDDVEAQAAQAARRARVDTALGAATRKGLAWGRFSDATGTLGVPRAEMPQIKAEHRGAMVNFLKARGVDATQQEMPADELKPTQAEFSSAKVKAALGFGGADRSILVSSDGHVLDGHHQWLAKLASDEPVKVIRLNAPIAELLPLAKEFPSSTTAKGAPTVAQTAPPAQAAPGETTPASSLDDFVGQMPKGRQSMVKGFLNEPVTNGTRTLTRAGLVHDQIADGARVESLGTESALVLPDGRQIGQQVLGKVGMDYARHLAAKATATQQEAAQTINPTTNLTEQSHGLEATGTQQAEAQQPQAGPEAELKSRPTPAAPAALSPAESAGRARNVRRVEQIAKGMSQKWAAAPKITVVHDLSDPRVPEEVRAMDQAQRSGGSATSPEGVYSSHGEVFLMAGQLPTTEDVARVVAHEVLGHHGLRQFFGKSLDTVLKQILAMRPALVKAKIQEYGLNGVNLSDQMAAAEEVLADMAQTQPQIGFVRRAVAAIRTWLRENVAGFKGMRLSDDEIIRSFILPARAFVERGVDSGAINGIPAFSREGEGFTPLARGASTFDDARTAAKDFQGKTLHNAATGMDAVVSRNSLDKMLSAKAVGKSVSIAAHVNAVANADKLFERAVLVDSHPDGKELGTIKAVHRFYAPMRFGGKVLQVKMTVKEFAQQSNGNRLYTVEAMDLEPENNGAASGGLPEVSQGGVGGAELNPVAHQPEGSTTESVVPDSPEGKPAFSRGQAAAWVDQKLNTRPETIVGDNGRQYTAAQLQAMRNVGMQVQEPSLAERAKALYQDAGKKLAQGIVDQFAPVKDLDQKAYLLLRLSKGATGAFESFLRGGLLKLSNGVYDFDEKNKGGVVDRLLMPLGGEHHDFFRWVAANRAERLMAEGKENLFTAADIQALKTLSNGQASFDYVVQNGMRKGQTTRNRAEIYRDSLATFNRFNKNILDMAEQSGLIDGSSRHVWEHEFYVPFFRAADDVDGGVRGMNVKGGMLRQQAFKALKGGKGALSADLLDNTLMNWAHLLDASAKNRAAKATLEAAARMGAAIEAPEDAVRDMGKSMGMKSGAVWFMDQGQKRHFLVEDPFLLTALNSLEYAGMKNPMMNAMGAFKHALTVGVTASPFFKIRNLIRDSVQVIGTSPIGYNPAANIAQGWKLTDPKSDAYFRLLAGGGTIHFGTMVEGSEAKRLQRLVESGVDKASVLDSEHKVQAFYRRYVAPGIEAYNELGNRGEAVNRAALYDQLIKQGVGHDEASLMARDLMDFSMQGSFTSIRFLTQVVPFFNARIQGLYKLGKAAKEDPARFGAVLGTTAMVSLGLLAAYSDDDDWKKREDWDRNNYWWFKFGGTAFRIPKPFEIGAVATLAERGFELAFEKEMTGTRFRQQVLTLMGDQLSMNPVPQLVKPILDVYANKDSFSGRPIETLGMDKLKPEYRFNDRTTMAARATSTAANGVTGLIGLDGPSPVQVDHMLQGYFGWLGSFVVGAADVVARPATGQNERATPDYWKTLTGSMASDLRDAPSRYVSQMYTQAKELEEAYGTWQHLLKERKTAEAAEFRADHQEELQRYRKVENVKKMETRLGQQIRAVERSDMDSDAKREKIRSLREAQDRVARLLVPS